MTDRLIYWAAIRNLTELFGPNFVESHFKDVYSYQEVLQKCEEELEGVLTYFLDEIHLSELSIKGTIKTAILQKRIAEHYSRLPDFKRNEAKEIGNHYQLLKLTHEVCRALPMHTVRDFLIQPVTLSYCTRSERALINRYDGGIAVGEFIEPATLTVTYSSN
jgi:hypothetical protein